MQTLKGIPQGLTPLQFFSGFLLIQGLYLWDRPNWYPLLILAELLWVLFALYQPKLRLAALLMLFLLLPWQVHWLIPQGYPPQACLDHPQEVRAIAKSSSFEQRGHLDLMQLKVHCGGVIYPIAAGRILFDLDAQPRGWYLPGEQIKIKHVQLVPQGIYELLILPEPHFRIYNQTDQEERLARSSLFHRLQAKAGYYLDHGVQGLYLALVTGDRQGLEKHQKSQIRILGLSHLFAVSGMHIGVIYLWISFLLNRLSLLFPRQMERGRLLLPRDLLALVLIFAFVRLIGEPISALRSFEMLFYWIVIRHFLPWQPLWMTLFGVAAMILAKSPWLIGNLSFQLSFLSVYAIFILLPLLPKSANSGLGKIRLWLLGTMVISCWLFVFTLPLVLSFFGKISLMAVPSNPVHIFYMALIFLPISLFTLGLSLIGFGLGITWWDLWSYALVQFLGQLWLQLLEWNASIAQGVILHKQTPWELWEYGLYWGVLSLLAWGGAKLKKKLT